MPSTGQNGQKESYKLFVHHRMKENKDRYKGTVYTSIPTKPYSYRHDKDTKESFVTKLQTEKSYEAQVLENRDKLFNGWCDDWKENASDRETRSSNAFFRGKHWDSFKKECLEERNFVYFSLEMLVESVRGGFYHQVMTYAQLRFMGYDYGGHFRKHPGFERGNNSTRRKHIRDLVSMGMISYDKVHSHRDYMMEHCMTNTMARMPVACLTSKDKFRGFILGALIEHLNQKQEFSNSKGVAKFNRRKRGWEFEWLDRSVIWSQVVKFKTLGFRFRGGFISNAVLGKILNLSESTVKRWFHEGYVVKYLMHHSILGTKDQVPKHLQKGETKTKGVLNHFNFTDRLMTSTVRVFRNDYLTEPYLKKFYQTSYREAHESSLAEIFKRKVVKKHTTSRSAERDATHLFHSHSSKQLNIESEAKTNSNCRIYKSETIKSELEKNTSSVTSYLSFRQQLYKNNLISV